MSGLPVLVKFEEFKAGTGASDAGPEARKRFVTVKTAKITGIPAAFRRGVGKRSAGKAESLNVPGQIGQTRVGIRKDERDIFPAQVAVYGAETPEAYGKPTGDKDIGKGGFMYHFGHLTKIVI
jgi:hypothetical protein